MPSAPRVARLALACSLLLLLLLGRVSAAAEPAPAPLTNPFAAFSFTLEQRPAAAQVALLSGLGYQGMTVGGIGMGGGVELLKSYAAAPQVRQGQFRVYGILWWVSDAHLPLDLVWLDQVLTQAAALQAALWVVVEGPKDDPPAVVALLRAVADRCHERGVTLVLYPHWGCTFADAEQAYTLWQQLERPAVRLSIHLCHEIKAGQDGRLGEVVAKVAPLLALASVSGAEVATMRTGGWEGAILPLDRGDYDVRPYLRALSTQGYQGPVVLHTYGLKDPPEQHLARSLARWRLLVAELGR